MRALENVATDFVGRFSGFTEKVIRTHEDPNIYTVTFDKEDTHLGIEVVETEDPEAPNVLVLNHRNIGRMTLQRMMNYFMRRLTSPPPRSSRSSGQPLSRDLSSEFDRVQ
jgi:hypothetical protein